MKRFFFPAAMLLILAVLLAGQDALAATGMGIKLPEDPTKAYITLGILVAAAVMFFTEIVPLPITALLDRSANSSKQSQSSTEPITFL